MSNVQIEFKQITDIDTPILKRSYAPEKVRNSLNIFAGYIGLSFYKAAMQLTENNTQNAILDFLIAYNELINFIKNNKDNKTIIILNESIRRMIVILEVYDIYITIS
jgi:hypothetical protein